MTTAYIRNKLLSSAIHYQISYERLYDKKHDCDHLRVVGCLCYAKVVNEHDNLLPRTKSTILMSFFFILKKDMCCMLW